MAKNLNIVTKRKPTDGELEDMLFAWKVAKHVKANAIVYAKNNATVGIGAGGFCDGQIQVFHDLIGLYGADVPKHAKSYLNLKNVIKESLNQYKKLKDHLALQ